MAEKFHFDLVGPEKFLESSQVDSVIVPGAEGEFQVFKNHTPFLCVLRPGVIVVENEGGEERFYLNGGIADVGPEWLNIMYKKCFPEMKNEAAFFNRSYSDIQAGIEILKILQQFWIEYSEKEIINFLKSGAISVNGEEVIDVLHILSFEDLIYDRIYFSLNDKKVVAIFKEK